MIPPIATVLLRCLPVSVERETGIEPATSSLGNWISIENKEHPVYGVHSEASKNPTKSVPPFVSCLNAAELRHTIRRHKDHLISRFLSRLELRVILSGPERWLSGCQKV